jgi:hypothetical protein
MVVELVVDVVAATDVPADKTAPFAELLPDELVALWEASTICRIWISSARISALNSPLPLPVRLLFESVEEELFDGNDDAAHDAETVVDATDWAPSS